MKGGVMAEELDDLTDEMKAAVGVETSRAIYEVTTQGIRTFARSVGYTDTKYYEVPKLNTSALYLHGDESYIQCPNHINLNRDF